MVGANKIERAKEVFKKYNGCIYGAENLKNIVRMYLTGDEKKVVEYLKILRAVGILTEEIPFKFRINTNAELKILADEVIEETLNNGTK